MVEDSFKIYIPLLDDVSLNDIDPIKLILNPIYETITNESAKMCENSFF